MVMMTVTPADAKPARMSTTLAALLLSKPAAVYEMSLSSFARCWGGLGAREGHGGVTGGIAQK